MFYFDLLVFTVSSFLQLVRYFFRKLYLNLWIQAPNLKGYQIFELCIIFYISVGFCTAVRWAQLIMPCKNCIFVFFRILMKQILTLKWFYACTYIVLRIYHVKTLIKKFTNVFWLIFCHKKCLMPYFQKLNEILEEQKLPLEVVEGYVDRIRFSVPLKSIFQDSVSIDIRGLEISIKPINRSAIPTGMWTMHLVCLTFIAWLHQVQFISINWQLLWTQRCCLPYSGTTKVTAVLEVEILENSWKIF